MVIDEIKMQVKGSRHEGCARVTADSRSYEVWFQWEGAKCPTPADAYLALAIQPAMRLGSKLIVKGSVSGRLLMNIPKIQEIYRCWDRKLSIVEVDVNDVRPWNPGPQPCAQDQKTGLAKSTAGKGAVGSTFTGGVDSFYTLLKHLDEIQTLIFVSGFELRLEALSLRDCVSKSLQNAASQLGKAFIEVETNLRQFSDNYANWSLYHGAAIAATGIIVSGRLSKFYIPSTHSYADLFPWGSHPVLDPLFSTDQLEFEHDGCEATRFEKIEALAANSVAMKTLRVCWEHHNRNYNCGKCEKCLRTMVSLQICGALDRCVTFNRPLNLKKVANVKPTDENARSFIRENIEAGERIGADPNLLAALRRSLSGRIHSRPHRVYLQARRTAAAIYHYFRQPLIRWR